MQLIYNLELLLSSHTGTNIDAPYHFVKNGLKIDQIPLDRLVGNTTIIKFQKTRNAAITKLDITLFEKKNGNISNMHLSSFLLNGKKI